jgi:hypothetical protein
MTNLKELLEFIQQRDAETIIISTEQIFSNTDLSEDARYWTSQWYTAINMLEPSKKEVTVSLNDQKYSTKAFDYIEIHKDMIMLHCRVIQAELVNKLTPKNLKQIQYLIWYWNDLESILGDL